MDNAIEFLKKRRSIYAIGKNIELNNEEITELIEGAVKNSPTAFNSQTVRAVITFGESSDRVWDIVLDELRKVVKDDGAFLKTKEKIATFKAGFGTVLYFTETATVKKLEKDFPLYADNFATGRNKASAAHNRPFGKFWQQMASVLRFSTITR